MVMQPEPPSSWMVLWGVVTVPIHLVGIPLYEGVKRQTTREFNEAKRFIEESNTPAQDFGWYLIRGAK
jgi:hypothetical protein